MYRFRLDDFDHHFRIARWESLPPIAAHIRWLKRRLEELLPRQFTSGEAARLLELWDSLVDEESITWRYGNSPHGWYSRYPDVVRMKKERPRYEDGETFGVASRTGTEVMTVAQWLANSEREAVVSFSDGPFDGGGRAVAEREVFGTDPGNCSPSEALAEGDDLAHLLGVVTAYRIQDAELRLLRGDDPQGAWHLISEAVELINRAERISLIEEIAEQRAAMELKVVAQAAPSIDKRSQPDHVPTRGRFYIGEDGAVLVELFGLRFSGKIRNNSKGGLRCIQAILKSPTGSLPNETLALEYAGYTPLTPLVGDREEMISKEEHHRLLKTREDIERRKKELDPDLDDYDDRCAVMDEELSALARDLTNRTYAGRRKMKRGPIEERQRKVGTIISRAIKSIIKNRREIGVHLKQSLKGLTTERIHYCPSEPVEWEFGPPESSEVQDPND